VSVVVVAMKMYIICFCVVISLVEFNSWCCNGQASF
jgi:hypothetical protein